MRRSAALVLLLGGIIVAVFGHRRAESVAGLSSRAGTRIANAWDGGFRVPEHAWYYAAGGVLVLAGGALLLRRG